MRLADGFNVLGQSEKAAALYQSLLADFPDAPLLQENLRAKLTDIYLRGKDRKRAVEQLEVITLARNQGLVVHFERPGGPLCIHDGRGQILRRSPSTPSAKAWLMTRS